MVSGMPSVAMRRTCSAYHGASSPLGGAAGRKPSGLAWAARAAPSSSQPARFMRARISSRRRRAPSGLRVGSSRPGAWIKPASVAASAAVSWSSALSKYARAPATTP
jgi:hypothetical protein